MNNENLINNSNVACSNCGASNMVNSKFCIKCGNPLQTSVPSSTQFTSTPVESAQVNPQVSTVREEVPQVSPQINAATIETPQANTQTVQPSVRPQVEPQVSVQPTYAKSSSTNGGHMNYFKYILNTILKPFDSFKKEEDNLSSFKNTGILAAIIVGILTILKLISTMITSVRVVSFWTGEVEWVWENLKEIEYIKTIGQSLLVYAGIIFAISGVYFLASLVIKKETKFVKLLSATTTAFIPVAVSSSILSPILSLINSYLGIGIVIVGFVYSLVILLELLNDQIVIENKNIRIYFHLICLSVLLIGGAFVAYKLLLGSLNSGLGSLTNGLDSLGSLFG